MCGYAHSCTVFSHRGSACLVQLTPPLISLSLSPGQTSSERRSTPPPRKPDPLPSYPSTCFLHPQGRFLKLAVAWTAARGQRLSGDPELCGLLGRCLWNEGELDRGTRYLVLGERPQELCDLILQEVPDGKARYVQKNR